MRFTHLRGVSILGLLLMLAACKSNDGTSKNAAKGAGSADSGTSPVAGDAGSDAGSGLLGKPRAKPADSAFQELIGYDWSIGVGVEQYYCVYKTLTEDLWISDFAPIAPAGTHHVTLGVVDVGPPDGVIEAGDTKTKFPCTGTSLGDTLAYGAVRKTQGFDLPQGVAVKIPAGKQLLLSVHVLNVTDAVLTGRTGISIVKADPATIESEAENIFAMNPLRLTVKPGKSTFTTDCTMTADGTILALLHHMHLTGVHQKTTLIRTNGEKEVLLDAPFVFDEQLAKVLDVPVKVKEGDKLEVECQFENPGPDTLLFGESTTKNEMCITSFYRYPAVATSFVCSN